MTRPIVLWAVAAGLLLAPGRSHAEVKVLHPESGARLWLPVGKQTRLYFRAASGEAVTLIVTGPGELKLIVRAVAGGATGASVAYTVTVSDHDHTLKTLQARAAVGTTKWKDTEELASESGSLKLAIPAGKHALKVTFASSDAKTAGIRYVFREGTGGEPQVLLHAKSQRESVTLVVKERVLDYYVADFQSPVEVEVIGPTRLRVVSRLICAGAARGDQHYLLKLQRDGQPLPDQSLVTTASSVVQCEAHPDWIVGKSRTFYLDIPKGAHVVTVRAANADAPGVAFRFSIPKEDLANGH